MAGVRKLGEKFTEPLTVRIEQQELAQVFVLDVGSLDFFGLVERFHASRDLGFTVPEMAIQVLDNPNESLEPLEILLRGPCWILSHGQEPFLGFNESTCGVLPTLIREHQCFDRRQETQYILACVDRRPC